MAILREQLTRLSSDEHNELYALDELACREATWRYQIHGWRYDVGVNMA